VFSRSAQFYDAVYSFKDYDAEAAFVDAEIRRRNPEAATLLDVACGTGAHLAALADRYEATGLDLDPALLAIARERCPSATFHQADMTDFDLGRRFGAVTCMFSSVGYLLTTDRLESAIAAMARHLEPGGVLVLEPWLTPEAFVTPHVGAVYVNEPELKIARVNSAERRGRTSVFEFHYLVGTPDGVDHFTERHELGLFTVDEHLRAFEAAGLYVEHDPGGGPMGRGLYVAVAAR
jgi:ubiquinone/menaquinone biosynthesis C-methylase UbiE